MRRSSVAERIRHFNNGRDAKRLKLKYKAMRKGPFPFFRGTCHLFYEDWPTEAPLNHAPLAWLCGDLHLENFGTYKGVSLCRFAAAYRCGCGASDRNQYAIEQSLRHIVRFRTRPRDRNRAAWIRQGSVQFGGRIARTVQTNGHSGRCRAVLRMVSPLRHVACDMRLGVKS